MKKRLPALDGLRGFAALCVMLSHLDHNLVLQASGPVVTAIFRTLAAGPNAVQILFVLTGFLMAYLYPTIQKPFNFIQKRYTRIFPVFLLTVIYFWLINNYQIFQTFPTQILLILFLAGSFHFLWKGIKNFDTKGYLGKILFVIFLILQVTVLFILIFFTPKLITNYPSGAVHSFVSLFANATLTMSFSTYSPLLNSVFWSLTAEVLFYICFPFFVLPLIQVSKKWGWIVGLLIIAATTKILFDIDKEVMYQGGLMIVNIARASGFIAGVTVGTLFQQQGKIWKMSEKIINKPFVELLILFVFILMQWGDTYLRQVADPVASNYYFLVSSWIIAITIIAAINKKNIIQKIFSKKIFVFLGAISYALYLTHAQAISWTMLLLAPLQTKIPLFLYVLLLIILATTFSILLAWLIYKVVDSLYFVYHKRIAGEATKTEIIPAYLKRVGVIVSSIFIYAVVIISIFAGRFSPSLFIERHVVTFLNKSFYKNISLLSGPVIIPFSSTYNNLSIVALNLKYQNKASQTKAEISKPAVVEFSLIDTKGNQIFESKSTAYLTEGTSEFQFGFPPILNSAHEKYRAKLQLINGSKTDQVLIFTDPTNFITFSIMQSGKIRYIYFLINRVFFALSTPPALFALLIIPGIIILERMKKRLLK